MRLFCSDILHSPNAPQHTATHCNTLQHDNLFCSDTLHNLCHTYNLEPYIIQRLGLTSDDVGIKISSRQILAAIVPLLGIPGKSHLYSTRVYIYKYMCNICTTMSTASVMQCDAVRCRVLQCNILYFSSKFRNSWCRVQCVAVRYSVLQYITLQQTVAHYITHLCCNMCCNSIYCNMCCNDV